MAGLPPPGVLNSLAEFWTCVVARAGRSFAGTTLARGYSRWSRKAIPSRSRAGSGRTSSRAHAPAGPNQHVMTCDDAGQAATGVDYRHTSDSLLGQELSHMFKSG